MTITAGIIALNCEETIKLCLDSIHDHVDEIIIIFGAVEDYKKANPDRISTYPGHCIDNSISIAAQYPRVSYYYQNSLFKNKARMQNEILGRIGSDIYLRVDADEIWTEDAIKDVKWMFKIFKDLECLKIPGYHFWKSLDHIARGPQWDAAIPRVWRWNSNWKHPEGMKCGMNMFYDVINHEMRSEKELNTRELTLNPFFHLGYSDLIKPENIRAKITYYKYRGIEREHEVMDTWSNWKAGDRISPTHIQEEWIDEFPNHRLPEILRRYITPTH
jgi:hypothetical protein